MMQPRVHAALAMLVLSACASGAAAPTPAPAPLPAPEVRVAAVIEEWAKSFSDPAAPSRDDLRGGLALTYRALSIVSPSAGSAVGQAAEHAFMNVLVCAIPVIGYLYEYACRPDHELLLPAGDVGKALAAAGIVGLSEGGDFVELPPKQVAVAFAALLEKRRQALAASGAATCRFVSIEGEWHPEPMPQDGCDGRVESQDKAGTCTATLLFWNTWQDDVARVWLARATCGGTPAMFAISARAEHDHRDGVLFVAIGSSAEAALEYGRKLR